MMSKYKKFLIPFYLVLLLFVLTNKVNAQDTSVTAIDIALEPDVAMSRYAEAVNSRLLKVAPQGFALDATHHPHITLLQCYVRTDNLDDVYAAVGRVLADNKIADIQLTAYQYFIYPWQKKGVAVIALKPTKALLKLQQDMLNAITLYIVRIGTPAAFFTTPDEPTINRPTMGYVKNFIHNASGKNYNPHVTVGIAPMAYLNNMKSKPFTEFSFTPAEVSVYQLGNFGTARKKLKGW